MEVARARAWLQEYGPPQDEGQEEHHLDDFEGEGDYKDLARRRLEREKAVFCSLAEDEVSLLSASFLRQLQLIAPLNVGGHTGARAPALPAVGMEERGALPSTSSNNDELWLDRRQRRAQENERIVKRLFDQQRKRRFMAT